jgi:glucosylceramidase
MHTLRSLLPFALAFAGTACAPTRQPAEPGGAPGPDSGADVSVWLTTADQRKLLERQPGLAFGAARAGTGATIAVDESQAYQSMVGFGAAITGASAWLIHQRMSPEQRDSLLRDLFDPAAGLGLSFTRLPMGASDFSLTDYSYDDVPAGETDRPPEA